VKLDGTVQSTTGAQAISAFGSALNTMPEYSGVHTGTITLNGHQIAIDPATTTLRGLVSAVNGVADLSATLDEARGTVRFRRDGPAAASPPRTPRASSRRWGSPPARIAARRARRRRES